jgi:hypothetical protein
MAKGQKFTTDLRNSRSPLIPAPVAGIGSLIVPGLGQVLAGSIQRGLLLFGSMAAIVAMLGWRIKVLAHLEPTAMAMLTKAFSRRPFFVGLILACLGRLPPGGGETAGRLRHLRPGPVFLLRPGLADQ